MENKDKEQRSKTRLYKTYYAMLNRCYSPNNTAYRLYGGRDIGVCQEWRESYDKFVEWSYANGYDPSLPGKLNSIDRIDPDGDYSPENCRWITMAEQMANRRCVIKLMFNGETHNLQEWADITGINYETLYKRYRVYHWPVEDVLTHEVSQTYISGDGERYTIRQIADIAGISMSLAWSRINKAGWAVDEVLAGKNRFEKYAASDGQKYSLQQIAQTAGIDKTTAWRRLNCLGWTVEQAMTKGLQGPKTYVGSDGVPYTVQDMTDATGVKQNTIYKRLEKGWSVDEILAGHRFAKTEHRESI